MGTTQPDRHTIRLRGAIMTHIKQLKSGLAARLGSAMPGQGSRVSLGSSLQSLPFNLPLKLCLTAAVVAMGAAGPAVAQALPATPAAGAQAESAGPVAGRYLFGQSAQPDQLGQGYVVLERSGDRVYGALYFPSSSFDCFYGQVQGNQLAMTIVNSYDQQTYPYSLALADGPAVAASGAAGALVPFGLDGFYAIDSLSDNDHRMLEVCRATLPPQF